MAKVLNFYMDDSGSRHLDRRSMSCPQSPDWFALGGILIAEYDVDSVNEKYGFFCEQWEISYPLRSYNIRNKNGNFKWLQENREECLRFWQSLQKFLISLPVQGLACVVDRPGYNLRYRERYGHNRWSLSKSAFSIVVERAVKYAVRRGMKLRIIPEKCNKIEDEKLRDYYESLRVSASPFNPIMSAKYLPITATVFKDTLHEFRLKSKASALAQIADLYLWPMCMGGYRSDDHAYRELKNANRLVDCIYSEPEIAELGIKYYCLP